MSIHCLQDFCDVLGGSSRTLSRTLVLVKHPMQFRRRLDNVEEHLNSAEWSDCSRQQLGTGVTMTTVSVVIVTPVPSCWRVELSSVHIFQRIIPFTSAGPAYTDIKSKQGMTSVSQSPYANVGLTYNYNLPDTVCEDYGRPE